MLIIYNSLSFTFLCRKKKNVTNRRCEPSFFVIANEKRSNPYRYSALCFSWIVSPMLARRDAEDMDSKATKQSCLQGYLVL